MLKILRKKGIAKKIIWVIAIVIIISFGFMGTAYLLTGNKQNNFAGKIFGKKIDFDDFNESYRHVRIQAMMKYGDKFRDVEEFLDLEKEAWDRLILLSEVKKRKIKVSDEEVVKAIESLPYFQRDKQFDSLLYNDIIRFGFKIKPREFEESMRDTLKFSKLFKEVTKNVIMLDEEIFNAYKEMNEKVQISYVLFEPKNYVNQIAYNAEGARNYYDENTLDFTLPPSINVNYFEIELPEQNSDEEQAEENPEEIEAREEEIEKLTQKATLVYEDLLLNPDIQEVAQQNEIELYETGLFNIENPELSVNWSFDVLNEIIRLPEGQVAGPFESGNKLYIIQVKEKKDSVIPSYEEAEEQVKDTYLLAEAKKIASEKASALSLKINQEYDETTDSFDEFIRLQGLDVIQSPEFKRDQYLPKVGISKEFQEAAFSLSQSNKISGPIVTEAGVCILHFDAAIPVKQVDYQRDRDEISSMLINQKRNETFVDFMAKLRIKANLENNLAKLRGQSENAQ